MHKSIVVPVLIAPLCAGMALPAYAMDARSAALGGSAIANGAGVHGTLENPSTLMRIKRDGRSFHLHAGFSADVRDNDELIDRLSDEEDLPDDIEDEINRLNGQIVSCDPVAAVITNTECVTDLESLGGLASRVLDVFDDVDDKPVTGSGTFDLGFASTATAIPFAIHLRASVTAFGKADIDEGDRAYVDTFATVLADGTLTREEIENNAEFTLDATNQTLTVQQPEDVLSSTFSGSAMIRQQLGVSLAHSIGVAGFNLDIGVTPKFSTFQASNIVADASEQFRDNAQSYKDQFEESEATESSFTFDAGVTTSLKAFPIRVSAVARNMIPESVSTKEGFEFETTPQLIVGGAFDVIGLTLSADMALNKAKVDNLETQIISLGAEFGGRLFALRAGISHDNARDDDATALSLGASLGPLHIGGRLTGVNSAQASAQLAFSF